MFWLFIFHLPPKSGKNTKCVIKLNTGFGPQSEQSPARSEEHRAPVPSTPIHPLLDARRRAVFAPAREDPESKAFLRPEFYVPRISQLSTIFTTVAAMHINSRDHLVSHVKARSLAAAKLGTISTS